MRVGRSLLFGLNNRGIGFPSSYRTRPSPVGVITFKIGREVEYRARPLGDEAAGALAVGLRLLRVLVQVHHRLPDARLLQERLVYGRELQRNDRPSAVAVKQTRSASGLAVGCIHTSMSSFRILSRMSRQGSARLGMGASQSHSTLSTLCSRNASCRSFLISCDMADLSMDTWRIGAR